MAAGGQRSELVNAAEYDEAMWVEGNGRWAQEPESFDFQTLWNPRRQLILNQQGEWGAMAFWLAVELSDEETRQADLDGLIFFDQNYHNQDRSELNDLMDERIWPDLIYTSESLELIFQLHAMVQRQGAQEVFTLLAGAMRETRPHTVDQLLVEMDKRSENQINEVQP